MRLPAVATLSFALVVSASLHAQPGKTWDKTYPVNGRVSLDVTAGDASVRTTACGTCRSVSIHVDAHDQDLKDYVLEERASGNQVTFSLKRRNESGWGSWGHGRSPEVIIQTPSATDVLFKVGSGSTELTGVNGDLQVNTGSGGVHIADSTGHLTGNIGSGGFTAEGGFDQFHVRAGSGSVTLRLRPGQQMDADSSIATGSGSVHLSVPKDLRATLDAAAGSGSLHSSLPVLTSGDFGSRHAMHGTLNGGGPQLRITTGSGSTSIDAL